MASFVSKGQFMGCIWRTFSSFLLCLLVTEYSFRVLALKPPGFAPGYERMHPPARALVGARNLSSGFYRSSCPNFEKTVARIVAEAVAVNFDVLPELLRLPSHDAFVQGLDASLLLDPTPKNPKSEKTAPPNLTIGSYNIIDTIKKALEAACPGKVSCSDIVAAVGREALVQAGGPYIKVRFGRRDGRTSFASYALEMLTNPAFNATQLRQSFANAGLQRPTDILLIASHTIGRAHCFSFMDTIYPKISPYFNDEIGPGVRRLCPNTPANRNISNMQTHVVFLDQFTPFLFDNAYFINLLSGAALLKADHELVKDKAILALANKFAADQAAFFKFYAEVYNRMLELFVLTGNQGEVRRNCRRVN